MIEHGDSEIDSMLREIFPNAGGRSAGKVRVRLPGEHRRGQGGSNAGQASEGGDAAPGTSGAPELITISSAGLENLRRIIAGTQVNVDPPNHVSPPYQAEQIDIYNALAVNIPGGGYGGGTFTKIVTYTVPDNYEAVISLAGQQAETMAAYQDMQWRIRIDGKALTNYPSIKAQLFQFVPPGQTVFIVLRAAQTIDWQAASLSATSYNVFARLMGWQWPTRFIEGESASRSRVEFLQ